MTLSGKRTYVGFGFGAIQGGLFLYEAFQSRAFRRLVVLGNRPEVIDPVKRAGGCFSVNIAYSDRIEPVALGPVEIENPATEQGRACVIDAIAEAEEIGTAIPSVELYASHKSGSLQKIQFSCLIFVVGSTLGKTPKKIASSDRFLFRDETH